MSAAIEVRVPDIGDFKDVPVIEILVKPGTYVEVDTPLITIESEKATIDVPAPTGGVVEDIVVQTGERVSEGALILTIASSSPVPNEPARATPAEGNAPPSTPPRAVPLPTTPSWAIDDVPPHTSPSVRARCRRLEIDPKTILGSGSNGRVLDSDLDAHLKQRLHHFAVSATPAPVPDTDFERFGPIERLPLTRIAKRTAANLTRNWTSIPHVTNFEEADVSDLESFREKVNQEERAEPKITILAFLIKAASAALLEFPEFNASLDEESLIRKHFCHIGFAADTPTGLLVPVIRDVERKGLLQIAVEVTKLAASAREGKLSLSEMEGGCFTISSLGAFSGTGFTPIINAPEIAILGAARARLQPHWDGKQFVPRLKLPLVLSWDHRAVSGAPAARFLAFIGSRLADPRLLLL